MSPPTPDCLTLTGARAVLRPLQDGESERIARLLAEDPEASPWWSGDADKIRGWLEDPSSTVLVIEADRQAAGFIQFEEQDDPDYRFASIDIALLSPWIGQGLGSDALRTLARYLFEVRGHHRLHIDPAADNMRAIRAYERVGFKPVGIMRRYERGPDGVWRDALLMDMLREELTPESPPRWGSRAKE